MDITLFHFSKRKNSTKIPDDTTGTAVSVALKEETSYYNPTFILSKSPYQYIEGDIISYAKWGSRYFYINDIRFIHNQRYEIDCSFDVLATYRTQIMNSSAFVLYATSGYDIGIPDTRLSVQDKATVSRNAYAILENCVSGYLVSFIGEHISTEPVYLVSGSGLSSLLTAIQTNAFAELFSSADPANALQKVLTDTSSCITSCRYIPKCRVLESDSIVLAGGYNTGVTGNAVSTNYSESLSVTIPWQFPTGDFRNTSRYTSILVYLPGYGWVQVNTDDYVGSSGFTILISLDSSSGGLVYYLPRGTKCETNISTPLQVSTTTQGNAGGAIASAVGAVGSAISGNWLGAGIGGFNSLFSAMQTNVGAVGSLGSYASWYAHESIEIITIAHNTTVDPSSMATLYGRPVNRVMNIPDSGYVQTNGFSINISGGDEIRDMINNYLDGGVYIE